MKITIATGPIFPVPAVRGGAVQRLWEALAHEFVRRGHDVTIFAREFPGQAAEERADGIRYVRKGGYGQSTSIKRDLLMCFFYALRAAFWIPPGDVVVTNDFWMPVLLPWLNRRAGKVIPCLQRFPKNQCSLYGNCAALVAVSKAVADAVKAQSPSVASMVAVVPNALGPRFLTPIPPRKSRDQLRILYVGRIHPEKGLQLLATALRLLEAKAQEKKRPGSQETGWECVVMGPVKQSEGGGGEVFAEELRRRVEGLPVRFEAPVYDTEALVQIYDEADIFVYPSVAETGESFGLAPLEAMARGLVPVVSDLPVFREYLKPDVNGMVFDYRSGQAAQNMVSKLRKLLEDRDRRRSMGVAARGTAERFSTAGIADHYLKLFAETLQSGK